jgi:branched-chain amino acid transport system substrate-binding protein
MRPDLWLPLLGLLAASAPFKDASEKPLEYVGPGREEGEPDVREIGLAWFGPGDGDDAHGAPEPWRGALLAQDELNRAGGHGGRPFRLLPAWSSGPWGAAVVSLTHRVFDDRVWAIIGAPDGAATHLAAQVAIKANLLVLSPGSTDVSVHAASSPWMFSLSAGDDRQAERLAEALAETSRPFVVAAAAEHDSFAALQQLRRALAARGRSPQAILEFAPGAAASEELTARLLDPAPASIVVLAPPRAAGPLVAALRRRGFGGRLLGTAPLATRAFRRAAGAAANGVVVPLLVQPGPRWDAFARRYEERFGEAPDAAAGLAYDAVCLIAESVRRGGLNRAQMLDALRALSPWNGVTGVVTWEAPGTNARPIGLGTWRGEAETAGVR